MEAINKLYSLLISNNADIACGSLLEVYSRVTDNSHISVTVDNSFSLSKLDSLKKLLYMDGLSNSASGKIYKKCLFDEISYPKGRLYEDLGTTYKLFSKSERVAFTDTVVYFYFKDNLHSIVSARYSNRELDRIRFTDEELKFVESNYCELRDAAVYRLFYEAIILMARMPVGCGDAIYAKSIIKKYRANVISNRELSKKKKIFCYSSLFGHYGIKLSYLLRNKMNTM